MAQNCFSAQIISRDGELDVQAMEHVIESVDRHNCGLSYAVVAVIGPQSSGKSTLLNYLFGTNFRVMDASKGKSQTTMGIWMAEAVGVDPLTLVMDLEGSDSRVRADEENATFEKRSALFALAVADIVIINMWCHDIGRQDAACRPLQKTIFEVKMRLFASKKNTLLYVIRDKDETPFEFLESCVKEDTKKIWEEIPKPDDYKGTPLSEIFNVEVIALPTYLYLKEAFREEVAQLRQRFFHSITPGGLACDRRSAVPFSTFCYSVNQIWERIKENKDLDLPADRIMVATMRCKEIANEMLGQFASDEDWMAMNADPSAVSGFGRSASSILETYFSEYDDKCEFFDEDVRTKAKREYLEAKALELVYHCYKKLLKHLRSVSFGSFKNQLEDLVGRGEGFAAAARRCHQSSVLEFDQRCSDGAIEQANWGDDATRVREKLLRDIEAHTSDIRYQKLSELKEESKNKLSDAIVRPVESLFENCGPQTWASIRDLLGRKTEAAGSGFSSAIAGFELGEEEVSKMLIELKAYATNLVEKISRERAEEALKHMNYRFTQHFMFDNNSMPRVQNQRMGEQEIREIAMEARRECLKVLSIMAVIRLDSDQGTTDNVEHVLFSALMSGNAVSEDHRLDSDTWDDVTPEKTLITPIQCKALWEEFIESTDRHISITQQIYQQEVNNNNGTSRSFWAILLVVAGGGVVGIYKAIRDPTELPLLINEFVEKHSEDIVELYTTASKYVKSQGFMEKLRERVVQFWQYLQKKYSQFFGSERAYNHRIYQPLLIN